MGRFQESFSELVGRLLDLLKEKTTATGAEKAVMSSEYSRNLVDKEYNLGYLKRSHT